MVEFLRKKKEEGRVLEERKEGRNKEEGKKFESRENKRRRK